MSNSADRMKQRFVDIGDTGVDWERKRIYLIGDIDDDTSKRVLPALHVLDSEPGAIVVILNSNGGEESAGFAIYDAMCAAEHEIHVYGIGGVYSIAALILQGGTKRFMTPTAQLMIHNGRVGLDKNMYTSEEIAQLAKEQEIGNKRYHNALWRGKASEKGVSLKRVADWCKEERHFGAEEALSFGLIDAISEGPMHPPMQPRSRK